jgi:hypothetical protein
VNVSPLFIANAQPSELVQPSEGTFHYPTPSPEPATIRNVSLGEQRHDVAGTQTLWDCLRVITTVA